MLRAKSEENHPAAAERCFDQRGFALDFRLALQPAA